VALLAVAISPVPTAPPTAAPSVASILPLYVRLPQRRDGCEGTVGESVGATVGQGGGGRVDLLRREEGRFRLDTGTRHTHEG
jgi:hypothetical protein